MEEVIQNENTDALKDISDAYIAKKKRNRKIAFSIISFVTLALATIIIVLSCVKVNTKPAFIKDVSRYEITVKENSSMIVYENGEDKFKEFDKLFNEAFSLNYLTALFTGKLGGYELNSSNETTDNFYSDTQQNIGMSSILKNALGDNYVKVKFNEEKEVKYSNGKTYTSKYDSTVPLVFDELYFSLNSDNEDSTLTFYMGTRGYLQGVKITKITIKANTYSLYNYVVEN